MAVDVTRDSLVVTSSSARSTVRRGAEAFRKIQKIIRGGVAFLLVTWASSVIFPFEVVADPNLPCL